MQQFNSISAMLASLKPQKPVYCVHPRRYHAAVAEFIAGFPGRTLYAIKANNEPAVIKALIDAGICEFDCASLDEIELAQRLLPGARCYFMTPVRLPGAAAGAFEQHGVRHFLVDDISGIAALVAEIDVSKCVLFARMAVSHESADEDLSAKFGASPDDIPALLSAIAETGAEPALAFNVGSGVRDPNAYQYAIEVAAATLAELPFRVRLVDIGGGFPRSYPGYEVPPLGDYFTAIRNTSRSLPLADNAELMAEPGRALAATGLTTVAQVLLRKPDRLYINDGTYGGFWELRFPGHKQHKVRAYRDGNVLDGEPVNFTVFGPTCDSSDKLPEPVTLSADIDVGDYLVFESTGAYSLSGRTDFNGFDAYSVVTIND